LIFTPFVKIRTLNTYKKNDDYVFIIFFICHCNNILGYLYYIFRLFDPTNEILLIFIEKKLETEYVRKQLTIIQNVLKNLPCIENANVNI